VPECAYAHIKTYLNNNRVQIMSKDLGRELQECGAIKFEDFTLVSGVKSKYYIDIKKAITKPRILGIIRRHIIDIIVENNIKADYVACVELGAVPIGVAVSLATGLPLIIIRKVQKDYGIKNRIIGDIEKEKIVLFVEDVTTTGGTIISAVQVLRNEGMIVQKVISVVERNVEKSVERNVERNVDRDEGAEEALNKEGLTLISLVRTDILLKYHDVAEMEESRLEI